MYIGANPIGKRQIRIINNNPFRKLMFSAPELTVFLAIIRVPIIKGNLGFSVNEKDGDFVIKSSAIHAAIFANTGGYYSPPFGALAALDTAISDLVLRIADVEARVYGSEAAKMVAKRDVMRLLKKALNYVNNIAFDNQVVAGEVITGAKCLVNKPRLGGKADLKAVNGPGYGVVRLFAKALKLNGKFLKATYEWQFSIDAGRTWENIPFTNKARTTVQGMLRGIETSFRKRDYSEKTGLSDWSDPITFYPL